MSGMPCGTTANNTAAKEGFECATAQLTRFPSREFKSRMTQALRLIKGNVPWFTQENQQHFPR